MASTEGAACTLPETKAAAGKTQILSRALRGCVLAGIRLERKTDQSRERRIMQQKSTAARIFNVTDLEKDIADIIQTSPPVRAIDYAPPSVRLAAAANSGEIGKLSAEGITREFEAAAKEVEAMGQELQEAARRCEATVAGAHQAIAEVKETAALIRDKGKHYSAQIEDVSAMTAEVRATCSALKAKIAGPKET